MRIRTPSGGDQRTLGGVVGLLAFLLLAFGARARRVGGDPLDDAVRGLWRGVGWIVAVLALWEVATLFGAFD